MKASVFATVISIGFTTDCYAAEAAMPVDVKAAYCASVLGEMVKAMKGDPTIPKDRAALVEGQAQRVSRYVLGRMQIVESTGMLLAFQQGQQDVAILEKDSSSPGPQQSIINCLTPGWLPY